VINAEYKERAGAKNALPNKKSAIPKTTSAGFECERVEEVDSLLELEA